MSHFLKIAIDAAIQGLEKKSKSLPRSVNKTVEFIQKYEKNENKKQERLNIINKASEKLCANYGYLAG